MTTFRYLTEFIRLTCAQPHYMYKIITFLATTVASPIIPKGYV